METSPTDSPRNIELAYVRFGDLPPNGRSSIFDGDNGKIAEEAGVSVYEAVLTSGDYRILVPSPAYYSTFTTMLWLHEDRPLYLVEGERIGTGCDGEPLLKDPKIVKKIDFEFSSYNKNNPKFL